MTWPQIHNLKIQASRLKNVSRPQRIRIDVVLRVWMEYPRLLTIQHRLQSRWISKSKDAPTTRTQVSLSSYTRGAVPCTYLGSLLGAHTIAILSGIMT